jgi:endonuclease-3
MTKQERVTFVINTLKELYPTIPVPLDHKDLLIAVLFSAQCTDVCKPDYAFTFAKADNPTYMVK